MQAGQESLDDAVGGQLDATELRHLVRIEQIEPLSHDWCPLWRTSGRSARCANCTASRSVTTGYL